MQHKFCFVKASHVWSVTEWYWSTSDSCYWTSSVCSQTAASAVALFLLWEIAAVHLHM